MEEKKEKDIEKLLDTESEAVKRNIADKFENYLSETVKVGFEGDGLQPYEDLFRHNISLKEPLMGLRRYDDKNKFLHGRCLEYFKNYMEMVQIQDVSINITTLEARKKLDLFEFYLLTQISENEPEDSNIYNLYWTEMLSRVIRMLQNEVDNSLSGFFYEYQRKEIIDELDRVKKDLETKRKAL